MSRTRSRDDVGPASDLLRAAFEEHYVGVVRLCLALCGSRWDAEEIAQEAFVRSASHLEHVPPQAVGPYLRRVAVNVWKNRLRRAWVEFRARTPPRATSDATGGIEEHDDGRQLAMADPLLAKIDVATGKREALCTVRCPQYQREPEFSPDGRTVVFSDAHPTIGPGLQPFSLFLVDSAGGSAGQLTGADCKRETCPQDSRPTWSPDGSRIAFARTEYEGEGDDYQVEVVDPDGTGLQTIFGCSLEDCFGVSMPKWSPDRSRVAFTVTRKNGSEVRVAQADGSSSAVVATCSEDSCRQWQVVWSPEGNRLAYAAGSNLFVVDADGTHARVVAKGVDGNIAWLPAMRGSTPRPRPTSSPTPTDIPPAPLLPGLLAFSSDAGRRDESDVDVYSIATDGSGLVDLTGQPEYEAEPSWSPDALHLVYRNSNGMLMTMDADGSGKALLGPGFSPAWSPDGEEIAFIDSERGTWRLLLSHVDGSDVRTLVSQPENVGMSDPTWSPDGSVIVFAASLPTGSGQIVAVGRDGKGIRSVLTLAGGIGGPAWSPDGRRIAFAWETGGGNDLYLVREDGSGLRRLTDLTGFVGSPSYSSDGNWIAFMRQVPDGSFPPISEIDLIHADGSGLVRVFQDEGVIYDVAWQPYAGS